jgi:hypothetical protein
MIGSGHDFSGWNGQPCPFRRATSRATFVAIVMAMVFLPLFGHADSDAPVRTPITFSDPSQPGTVRIKLMNSGIAVSGYEGREVWVESSRLANGGAKPDSDSNHARNVSAAVSIKEQDNVVSISPSGSDQSKPLKARVPFKTSLSLSTMNDGDISVENVRGEIEASNMNGSILLTNIAGVVVAHSLNGKIFVRMEEVTPGKPMSFSTLNGDIEVLLPVDTKASLKLETLNGTISTEFEIGAGKSGGSRNRGFGNARNVKGAINGGGPEFKFKTINGSIVLRKK